MVRICSLIACISGLMPRPPRPPPRCELSRPAPPPPPPPPRRRCVVSPPPPAPRRRCVLSPPPCMLRRLPPLPKPPPPPPPPPLPPRPPKPAGRRAVIFATRSSSCFFSFACALRISSIFLHSSSETCWPPKPWPPPP